MTQVSAANAGPSAAAPASSSPPAASAPPGGGAGGAAARNASSAPFSAYLGAIAGVGTGVDVGAGAGAGTGAGAGAGAGANIGVGMGAGAFVGNISVTGAMAHLGALAGTPLRARGGRPAGGPSHPDDEGDVALDSASRHAAQLAPPTTHAAPALELPQVMTAATPTSPGAPLPSSLGDLMPGLVRKVAWSGDGRRGALRLELGSGALSGASLLVQASGGRVDVTLIAPPPSADASVTPAELDAWRERIAARLEARGIDVGAVDVG